MTVLLVFLSIASIIAQENDSEATSIQGRVLSAVDQTPLNNVLILLEGTLKRTYSREDGSFEFTNVEPGDRTITFIYGGYSELKQPVNVIAGKVSSLGEIQLKAQENLDILGGEELIPAVTLSVSDQQSEGSQDISGLLTASRDVFVSTAAFVFGSYRFRIRGLDSEYQRMMLNGAPMNDLEDGRIYWSLWGGLNDVTRNRSTDIGVQAFDDTYGGIGGAVSIDLRASTQRAGTRVGYAASNRTYRNRFMVTHSTGLMKNGWAVSASVSRRWAQEGFVEGTFYDAYAYFLSVDKKINDNHLFNVVVFGSPVQRGRNGAAVQELYDLAGTNYYNPFWGYQNGEKRNSRVVDAHEPVAMLRHDWTLGKNASLTTNVSYQFGKYGTSALDWYNSRNPNPDYYRRLPSFIAETDPTQAAVVQQAIQSDQSLIQVDWDAMYEANRNSFETIENANGSGESLSGLRSRYIVEDRRFDASRFAFNTIYENAISDRTTINGGITYQRHTGHIFKTVDDLLGGDFYVNLNQFAERDLVDNPNAAQNNIDQPNQILQEGDVFGYDYNTHQSQIQGWVQGVFSLPRFDLFLGGSLSQNTMWRTGNVRNGLFPDNSLGDSERINFTNYNFKGGATWKINGRNYAYASGSYGTQAPFLRHIFVSPRTRNELIPNLENETVYGGEIGYRYQAPKLKARVNGYLFESRNATRSLSFFTDEDITDFENDLNLTGGFINFYQRNIDRRHIGTEFAVEANIYGGLSVEAVAAVGQYFFTSRPQATIALDNSASLVDENRTIYAKNFRISSTPQQAFTVGLDYQGRRFWFASLNVSLFRQVWIDFNPNRRTEAAVALDETGIDRVEEGSDLWNEIISQEEADQAVTVDFFGGKSFKINDLFLYFNLGVSNILDNRDFRTGGYEQLRFDFDDKNVGRFPPRYFYAFGRTYFVSLTLRI